MGSISGHKYEDKDGNASTEADWYGLDNWVINLIDSNSQAIASTTTNNAGYYEFNNLPLGNYTLTEEMKSGWIQFAEPNPITLTSTATSSIDNDFINYLPECGNGVVDEGEQCDDGNSDNGDGCNNQCELPYGGPEYGYLKICKYVDDDGVLGTTEDQSPVGGWEFILDSGIATSSYSTLTQQQEDAEEGEYGCTKTIKLETGSYGISEILGNGWYAIEPETGSTTVNIEYNQTKTVNFYNTQYSSISGRKYNDANNNGKIDADESGLPDWKIQLVGCPYAPLIPGASSFVSKSSINLDADNVDTGSCSVIATTTTDMDGFYSFDMLRVGDYGVSEADQIDWTQTYPENQTFYYFNLGKGEATTTINFLNNYEKLPYCGDGIVNQETEQCDGSAGVGNHQTCSSDCLVENTPYCGDGIVNGNEECDGESGCTVNCVWGGGTVIITGKPEPPIVLGEEGDPILTISKTVNMKFVNPGDEAEYTVIIGNKGNLTAFDVTLDDTLPPGFTFSADGTITRTIDVGDIDPGDNRIFKYEVTVGDDVAAGVYTNTAIARASNYDPVKASANLEVKEIEVLGTELAETGFSVKEFALIVGIIFSSYGFAMILRRKYRLSK